MHVWSSVGRWHFAAAFKTLWFVVTLVTCKSDLYRVARDLSLKYLRTSERPFNIIALYMIVTSYMLLPVVIDIVSFYVFKDHYGYGMCFEVVKMSPLCLVVVIFYMTMIVTYAAFLCARCLRDPEVSVAIGNIHSLSRREDEPALLSDEENEPDDYDEEDHDTVAMEPDDCNQGDDSSGNVDASSENHEWDSSTIKTVDEIVGYDKSDALILDEVKCAQKRSSRTKIRVVVMAIFQPLLLWLWVVVVLHGTVGFVPSDNVDYGNLAMLWSVVAMWYVIISACFRDPK